MIGTNTSLASGLKILMLLILTSITGWRTFHITSLTLPPEAQPLAIVSVISFDGAILVWMLLYLFGCDGYQQQAVAKLMLWFSIVMTGILVVADVVMTANKNGLAEASFLGLQMSTIAIFTVGIVTMLQVAAGVWFFTSSQEAVLRMTERQANWTLRRAEIEAINKKALDTASVIAPRRADDWHEGEISRYQNTRQIPVQLPKKVETFSYNQEVYTPPVSVEYGKNKRLVPLGKAVNLSFLSRNGNGRNNQPNPSQPAKGK